MRCSTVGAVALTVALFVSSPLSAFEGFYSSRDTSQAATGAHQRSQRPTPAQIRQSDPVSACIAAIARAERRHGIPENLLLAIGLQESGLRRNGTLTVWPWTINHKGTGYRFDSKQEAERFAVKQMATSGPSIDVGCFQINLRWHPDAFADISDAFNPESNADYAARFLRSLRAETDTWIEASGLYHSRTPKHSTRYKQGILRNLQVAAKHSAAFIELAESEPPQAIASSSPTIRQNTRSLNATQSLRRGQIDLPQAYQQAPSSNQESTDAPAQSRGLWWSAELSSDASETEKRTIYSTKEIEPVLPNLIEPQPFY